MIAIVLVTMGPGFRHGIQKIVKATADILGFQHEAEQASELDQGFLNRMISNAQSATSKTTHAAGGAYSASETEHTATNTVSYTNGAFIED